MKKIFFLCTLLASASSFSHPNGHASKPYGMAGCGFGSVVVGKDGPQIVAATTNEISTQTFSISSGTSNCVTAEERVVRIYNFIEFNYASLSGQIAQGRGDSINALANLYGCNSQSFAQKIQQNYPAIFSSSQVDPMNVLVQINKVIRDTPELNNACAFGA